MQEKQATPQEALQFLYNLAGHVQAQRDVHVQAEQAYNILKQAIAQKQEKHEDTEGQG